MNASLRDLRQRAIRLLARREHTRAELERKLAPHGTEDDIQIVIAELQTNQLQSDARFAESWLRARADRLGTARLRQRLQQKGVAGDLIAASIAQADLGDERDRAAAAWAKKFGIPPVDPADWARQARFLQSRGFASDTIRRVVPAINNSRTPPTDDE
jgi:regulatory protein